MLPVRYRDAVKVIIDDDGHHSKQTFALTITTYLLTAVVTSSIPCP